MAADAVETNNGSIGRLFLLGIPLVLLFAWANAKFDLGVGSRKAAPTNEPDAPIARAHAPVTTSRLRADLAALGYQFVPDVADGTEAGNAQYVSTRPTPQISFVGHTEVARVRVWGKGEVFDDAVQRLTALAFPTDHARCWA